VISCYGIAASGNTYRVRLMLALLDKSARFVETDHRYLRSDEFRRLNPFGEAPVLVDGEVVLRDSQAILVYLARAHGGGDWLPDDAAGMAAVCQWLSFAANEIQNGPRLARAMTLGIVAGDLEAARGRARHVLALLQGRLSGRSWLEGTRPTIADVACYPYVFNAAEGGIDASGYPALDGWLARITALPGYAAMNAAPA
jgi:glutathione S-transferase